MLTMLAESAAFDVSAITPAVSAIGSLGFAIWFAFHTVTKTLPRQQKEHREQLKEIIDGHREEIKAVVTKCESVVDKVVVEMRSTRESFDQWRATYQAKLLS